MDIHEYQAKELLAGFGVAIPRGGVAYSPEQAVYRASEIGGVRWAVKALRVDYPVAVDSEHVIWRAFNNQYWPALYFIDAQGCVRHHQFGEGSYEQSEMVIQRLLAEVGVAGLSDDLVSPDARGLEVAAEAEHHAERVVLRLLRVERLRAEHDRGVGCGGEGAHL